MERERGGTDLLAQVVVKKKMNETVRKKNTETNNTPKIINNTR